MNKEQVFSFVSSVLSDYLGSEEVLKEDMSLRNDLGLDSLDTIDLALKCERKFDIQIPDDVVENFSTVGDVVQYICASKE